MFIIVFFVPIVLFLSVVGVLVGIFAIRNGFMGGVGQRGSQGEVGPTGSAFVPELFITTALISQGPQIASDSFLTPTLLPWKTSPAIPSSGVFPSSISLPNSYTLSAPSILNFDGTTLTFADFPTIQFWNVNVVATPFGKMLDGVFRIYLIANGERESIDTATANNQMSNTSSTPASFGASNRNYFQLNQNALVAGGSTLSVGVAFVTTVPTTLQMSSSDEGEANYNFRWTMHRLM